MKRSRYFLAFFFLAAAVLLLLIANICIGSVNIPLNEVVSILRGGGEAQVSSDIVLQIRLPRALAAAILGGGLALSGYLLQTFFHNPIAGPLLWESHRVPSWLWPLSWYFSWNTPFG